MSSSKEVQFSSLVLILYSSSVKQIFATNSVLTEAKYISLQMIATIKESVKIGILNSLFYDGRFGCVP